MSVTIECNGLSWTYERDKFIQTFPESLITHLMELDPDETHHDLSMPCITSNVLDILWYILEYDHIPPDILIESELAASYLNIPILSLLTDLSSWTRFRERYPWYDQKFIHTDIREDPAITDLYGWAYACDYPGLMQLVLMNDQFIPDLSQGYALKRLLGYGQYTLFRLLFQDRRTVFNAQYSTDYLVTACTCGHLDTVNLLLGDKRINPTSMALAMACRHGYIQIVDRLLQDPRINPIGGCEFVVSPPINRPGERKKKPPKDKPTGFPIYYAVEAGKVDIVHRLLKDPRVRDVADIPHLIKRSKDPLMRKALKTFLPSKKKGWFW